MSSNFSIPQLGITQQILEGIQLANQQKADKQAADARQRQLDIADREASTAASRLQVETPLINAQVTEAQNRARAQALALAQEQRASDYLFGDASGTQPHPNVSATMVNTGLAHPDVEPTPPQPSQAAPSVSTPLAPPDQLNVANPVGQTLATPAAPESTATQTGSSANVQTATPKLSPLDRDVQESIRLAGGVSLSELSQIQFLRQQLSFNPSHDGVVSSWNSVHALLQKRLTDPVTASSIAFQRQGLSETEANAAALRNANIASQLDKQDADTSAFTGEKAPSAISQLQGILKTPYLTADVKDHAQRNLAVAQQAVKNNLEFDALKKRQEQAITDGDSSKLGPMLAHGNK